MKVFLQTSVLYKVYNSCERKTVNVSFTFNYFSVSYVIHPKV